MRLRFLVALLVLGSLPALAQGLPAPTGLSVTAPAPPAGTTRLDLKWEKVPGAVGYEVLQWKGGKWWFNEDDPSRTPLTTSTSITGLDPETAYEFVVRAVGAGGVSSPQSASAGGRTLAREINVSSTPGPVKAPVKVPDIEITHGNKPKGPGPEAPTGLFAVFSDQDRVRLSWRAVKGAARYEIEELKDGQWKPAEDIVGDPKSNTVVIINHYKPGPYSFRIRCVGTNGVMGEPSFPVTADR